MTIFLGLVAIGLAVAYFRQNAAFTQYKKNHGSIETLNALLSDKEAEYNRLAEAARYDGVQKAKEELITIEKDIAHYTVELGKTRAEYEKHAKDTATQEKKVRKLKEQYKSFAHAIENYTNSELLYTALKLPESTLAEAEEYAPSVILKLHNTDIKDLRKAYNENDKLINAVLDKYASRYNTKANAAIYKLMVIALRSELQNVLYNLKYEKLDKSLELVNEITTKYLQIAGEGNQSIAPTLVKFIGEIDYLFANAVKIEYEYYVKKEQEKAEQAAIREQMRQEAEERRELQRQKEMIEREERKYNDEIEKVRQQMIEADEDSEKVQALEQKIKELQAKLDKVEEQKEDIINRQNGKAGNVYIISNIGSFGDNVFKIGMTRRLDPMDRVKELGDASVPFSFDVHSFIFSEDAVGLEKKLHDTLTHKRLNKVNLRKEFFSTTIDELEKLVHTIDPAAEFNTTILAEEYKQSQYMAQDQAQ